MGLQIEQRTDSLMLLLPCLLFSNGKCQTYGFRPKICSGYRCRLLIRVELAKPRLRTPSEPWRWHYECGRVSSTC